MVQEALVTAPCRVPVCDRDGNRAMLLEKGRCYYGTGSDTPYTMDVYSGKRRAATKQDAANFSRVCEHLDNIDICNVHVAGFRCTDHEFLPSPILKQWPLIPVNR